MPSKRPDTETRPNVFVLHCKQTELKHRDSFPVVTDEDTKCTTTTSRGRGQVFLFLFFFPSLLISKEEPRRKLEAKCFCEKDARAVMGVVIRLDRLIN